MFDVSYLADRKRVRCSIILMGCLVMSIGLTACLFSHSYMTASVSRVFLNVSQNVGLFSIEQYAVFGGGDSRARAKSTVIGLGDWERQACPPSATSSATGDSQEWDKNLGAGSQLCHYVSTIRAAGVGTCVLEVVTCLFLIFALHDLWRVARIDDTIMTTAPLTDALASRSQTMGEDLGTQITVAAELHPYFALDSRGLSVSRMPTVLALRTLQTVDNDTFAQLFQACIDRLHRCLISLRAALLLQCACSALWVMALFRAWQARQQLADFLTTWGEEEAQGVVPIRISLGIGGSTPFISVAVLALFLRLHSTLLDTDFKLVQQSGRLAV